MNGWNPYVDGDDGDADREDAAFERAEANEPVPEPVTRRPLLLFLVTGAQGSGKTTVSGEIGRHQSATCVIDGKTFLTSKAFTHILMTHCTVIVDGPDDPRTRTWMCGIARQNKYTVVHCTVEKA